MQTEVFLLNTFGVNEAGGNPAGVVLNASLLGDTERKSIARDIDFSETAFVETSDKADYKVSFFTPNEEVDICGHATVATYSLLVQKKLIAPGNYTQELKAGILPIEVQDDSTILLDLAKPKFGESYATADIVPIFSISERFISATGLLSQVVSTGNPNIMVPITTREALFDITPDFQKMAAFNKATNTIGFHLFTLDTIDSNATAHARNFFPLYGVDEEPATGNANASLACYLLENGKLSPKNMDRIIFEQGYSMSRPSRIVASLEADKGKITRVRVGGKANLIGKKIVRT